MSTPNVMLVHASNNCPVYLIDRETNERQTLLFDSSFDAEAWVSHNFSFNGNVVRDFYTVVLNEENLARYVEWANLTCAEIKAWLRQRHGAQQRRAQTV